MKIVSNYFSSITDGLVLPIVVTVAFVVFFAAVALWAMTARKQHIEKLSHLPFDNDELSR